MSWNNVNIINSFGDFLPGKTSLSCTKLKEELSQYDSKWVQYNPDKPEIKRYGLSVTSLDGGLSGFPDLHSLKEVYDKTGESYDEKDFNVPTEIYKNSSQVQKICDPWLPWLTRTHFLKIPPGGYFPEHRDGGRTGYPESFRLIVPIQNINPPSFFFLLNNNGRYDTLYWDYGKVYFLNTNKRHLLFNAGDTDSIWLILNVLITDESIQKLRMETY